MKKVCIILMMMLFSVSLLNAQSLSAGDLAIFGANTDNPDDFAFVLLVDIPSGTEIRFTDSGWESDNTFRGYEGAVKYTAPSAISAGTVITWVGNSANFVSDNDATVGTNGLQLSADGDQVFAFQGSSTNPTFIYAIQTNSNVWQETATSANDSAIPQGLTNGTNAAAVGEGSGAGDEYDNVMYNGTTNFSSPSNALSAVSNNANWVGDNTSRYTFSTSNWTLPVTLSTFTAQYLNSKPTLYWQTQSEEDNMGWFIYRNTIEDFTSAEKITGMIEGHGTTTQPQSYIYEDAEELQIEQTYYYWLESVDYSGTIHHFDKVAQVTIPHPDDPGQNVTPPVAYDISADPNPFAYSTEITFAIDQISRIDVTIYNVKGQMVKSFGTVMTNADEEVSFQWNGKDNSGKALSNGVYLYSVQVNGKDYATKQLILMK